MVRESDHLLAIDLHLIEHGELGAIQLVEGRNRLVDPAAAVGEAD